MTVDSLCLHDSVAVVIQHAGSYTEYYHVSLRSLTLTLKTRTMI
jgi:hypothetical protein